MWIFFECKFGCWMWINIFVNNNNSIECEWILTLWILHHFAKYYEKCSTFTFSLFFRKIAIYWPNAVWICSFFTFFLRTCHWLSRLIYLLLIIISTGYIFWWKIIGSGATSTSSTSMFPSALHGEALRVSGKQNSLLLGINRLCSATFEQLLAFWATLCSTSNRGQLWHSLVTFEQQIDIKLIQTIKGHFISKDFIKTGSIKTDFIKTKDIQ